MMSKLDNYQFDTHPLFDDEFNKECSPKLIFDFSSNNFLA